MTETRVIRVVGATKRFGATRALSDVSVDFVGGQVLALVGANGSGKSTLVKLLAGFHPADAGDIQINDGPTVPLERAIADQERLPIGIVHQDLGLYQDLSILENYLLPYIRNHPWGNIPWKRLAQALQPTFARYGISSSPFTPLSDCDRVTRAQVALARAVRVMEGYPDPLASAGSSRDQSSHSGDHGGRPRDGVTGMLILDEITAFLSKSEVDQLHETVSDIVASGHSVVLVSHDLDEIISFADKIVVLRNGKLIATAGRGSINRRELFTLISGHEPRDRERRERTGLTLPTANIRPSISVSLRISPEAPKVDFAIHRGEVLGLAGLVGAGFEEIPYALFGNLPGSSGQITFANDTLDIHRITPHSAIQHGIALVPANRNTQGLWTSLSIEDNLLPSIPEWHAAQLNITRIAHRGNEIVSAYGVRARNARQLIQELSGGNAQKVLMAKSLVREPNLLILHEPTQGVDVGARGQITQFIHDRTSKGMAVVCASQDHEYLAEVCHRVLVFDNGRILNEVLPPAEELLVSKEDVVWAIHNR